MICFLHDLFLELLSLLQASIEETNRVRAMLGLAPLRGSGVPPLVVEEPSAGPDVDPSKNRDVQGPLPMPSILTRDDDNLKQRRLETKSQGLPPGEVGEAALLAVSLDRYTKERPQWTSG